MGRRFDLNADVGEGFPYDADLLRVITSANVACGFHAGDADTMREMCWRAAGLGVAVGAQVSYRDREGFGRRDVDIGYDDLVVDLVEQVDWLASIADSKGTIVSYLKPHGALYNRVVWDDEQARAVVDAAAGHGLPVMGLPSSRVLERAAAAGLAVRREFFADRGYDEAGRLVPRRSDNALVTDPEQVAARVRQLVTEGTVTSVGGRPHAVDVDSICVHGDSPGALELARSVRDVLVELEAWPQ